MIDDFDFKPLITPLQSWFKENARILPWREQPQAYYVWISEIMLQQTRVEAVKPYFDRFIRELPNVRALAECEDDKLLKLWEGLGYYNRVRNLKIAANQIMDQYDGIIPSEYVELLKLKGIGHYTAGAIASIAYGKAVPAVDGNVLRVISRVTADDSDIMKQSVRTHVEEVLLQLMNNVQTRDLVEPAIFNQALMELGATVCVPNGAPHCQSCPWHDMCEARIHNKVGVIPVKTKAKARRIEERTVLIIKDGEKIALKKRLKTGLLEGMYELPNLDGYWTENEVVELIKRYNYEPIRIVPLGAAKHIFSHVEWQMKGYVVFIASRELSEKPYKNMVEKVHPDGRTSLDDGWIFVDVEETKQKYAIPSAFVEYAKYLNLILGKEAIETES